MTQDQDEKSPAPAVTRAVAVLDLLARSGGRALGLTDIARELGIAKSSTSNLIAALEEAGMVVRTEEGHRLGRRTLELGGAYLRQFDHVREFYRLCAGSPALRSEMVQIALLDGTDVLYLARHEGDKPLRLTAGIGDRLPASLTAMGVAMLTRLSDAEIRARFERPQTRPSFTERSVTSLEGLLQKVSAARARGYSIDDGEVFPNILGLAVALHPSNTVNSPLAVGASITRPNVSAPQRDQVAAALLDLADQLSNPMVLTAVS